MKYLKVTHAVLLALASYSASANHEPTDTNTIPNHNLDTIVVVGEHRLAPQVQTITAQDLRKVGAQNIDDMVLYTPGVDVRTDTMWKGHQGFTIRGVDGNRIAMSLDGVPLPEEIGELGRGSMSPIANRDTVEADTLKTVHIHKGGNAAENGNGSVGGSVQMQTYRPEDFVHPDKPYYLGVSHQYRSAYRSHGTTLTGATHQGIFNGLLMLTRRQSHELENYGENDVNGVNRTVSNHQNTHQYNVLAKAHFGSDNNKLETTFEQFYRDTDTLRSEHLGPTQNQTSNIEYSSNRDAYRRQRFSAIYRYQTDSSWLDEVSARLYRQNLEVENNTEMHTKVIATEAKQNQDSDRTQRQRIDGIGANLKGHFKTGNIHHQFQADIEYRRTKTNRLLAEDTSKDNLTTHTSSAFFPPADRRVFSALIKNDSSFANGIQLGLGLRYENERTAFSDDPIFLQTTLNKPTYAKKSGHSVLLPSASLTIPFAQSFSAQLAYHRGYLSPGVEYLGTGYANPRILYRIRSNPNLKPEFSNNYEAALQYRGQNASVKLTGFLSKYQNFLDLAQKGTPQDGFRVEYEYQNMNHAKAYGLELAADWKVTPQLKLSAAAAWMHSKVGHTGKAMMREYPLHGVLGIHFDQKNWGMASQFRWSSKHKRASASEGGNTADVFQAPAYGVWDLNAYYRPMKNLEINAGIYNITNRRYWHYADAMLISANSKNADRYTQPGRHFNLGIHLKF